MTHRSTLLIFIVVFSQLKGSIAQDTISGQSSIAVISAVKMNVLYVGLDNPIDVSIKETDKFLAKINAGKLIVKDGKYFVQCPQRGNYQITLFDTLYKEIASFFFLAKDLPQASISINSITHEGKLRKEFLSKDHCRLIPVNKEFDYELFYKVTSFRVNVKRLDGSIQSFENTGNGISEEMEKCFKTLEHGETVYFYNAKGKLITDVDFENDLYFHSLLITIISK